MANLSEITGSTINVSKDNNGKSILTQGECSGNCLSSSAAEYASFLINDADGEIVIKNNDRNERMTTEGPAKNFGSQAYSNGDIYLDAPQVNIFQKSVKAAGLDERTFSMGMVLLHESLHTNYGASFYRNDGKNFVDPKGFESSYKGGDTVDKVNIFRREMGLPIRASYGGHNPSSLRFRSKEKDGKYGLPFDVPIN